MAVGITPEHPSELPVRNIDFAISLRQLPPDIRAGLADGPALAIPGPDIIHAPARTLMKIEKPNAWGRGRQSPPLIRADPEIIHGDLEKRIHCFSIGSEEEGGVCLIGG